jgi:hypothetical protein
MKRDFDLIRRIMIDVESIPAYGQKQNFSYDGYDSLTINQHIALLIEAGLIKGSIHEANVKSTVLVDDLTWAGHDFLNATKDETLWTKAKENIIKPV